MFENLLYVFKICILVMPCFIKSKKASLFYVPPAKGGILTNYEMPSTIKSMSISKMLTSQKACILELSIRGSFCGNESLKVLVISMTV